MSSYDYAQSVVWRVIGASKWDASAFRRYEPAPFVDWSKFPTYGDYKEYLKSHRKRLYKEQVRRRRRLAENLGELVFCMDDEQDDVLDLARQWKSQQLRDTGVKNYFDDPKNREYFKVLRQKGLLTSSTLRASGRLLSLWLGFVHEQVWSGWVFTYDPDPELRKYSLGHQLLHSMLEESHRRKHREFDFSIGDEDYKWFYATNAKVLGTIGQMPFQQRIMTRAKQDAKQAISRHPGLFKIATSLKRAL